jgi:hypothetical protein
MASSGSTPELLLQPTLGSQPERMPRQHWVLQGSDRFGVGEARGIWPRSMKAYPPREASVLAVAPKATGRKTGRTPRAVALEGRVKLVPWVSL